MAGPAVTVLAIPIMYRLGKRKLAVAEQLGSRALRADAVEAIACGWLAFVVIVRWLGLRLALGGSMPLTHWRSSGFSSRKVARLGKVRGTATIKRRGAEYDIGYRQKTRLGPAPVRGTAARK